MTVATAPTLSASAITAPPCMIAGLVQNSGFTSISASTRSGSTVVNSIPRSAPKGVMRSLTIRLSSSDMLSVSTGN
jgi:hypothetical protein